MAVPKRKKSKSRTRMRRKSNTKTRLTTVKACPQCGAPQKSHRICPSCGYYKGRQVLTVRVD